MPLLAQTTDLGSNKNTKASEFEAIFSEAQDPVHYISSANHVFCYSDKLRLEVNRGLKTLRTKTHQTKPTHPEVQTRVIHNMYINSENQLEKGASYDHNDTKIDPHSHVRSYESDKNDMFDYDPDSDLICIDSSCHTRLFYQK